MDEEGCKDAIRLDGVQDIPDAGLVMFASTTGDGQVEANELCSEDKLEAIDWDIAPDVKTEEKVIDALAECNAADSEMAAAMELMYGEAATELEANDSATVDLVTASVVLENTDVKGGPNTNSESFFDKISRSELRIASTDDDCIASNGLVIVLVTVARVEFCVTMLSTSIVRFIACPVKPNSETSLDIARFFDDEKALIALLLEETIDDCTVVVTVCGINSRSFIRDDTSPIAMSVGSGLARTTVDVL